MNNKEILNIYSKIAPDGLIHDINQWELLLKHFRAAKMIQAEDLTSVDKRCIIFPMNLHNFLTLIAQIFNDQCLRDMDYSLEKLHLQINNCQTMINFWGIETLSSNELKCLLIAYNKVINESKRIKSDFEILNDNVQEIREDIEQNKESIDVTLDKIQTSFIYQKQDNFSIEKEYYSIRVRDVHYRNQPIKILKEESDGIIKQIGYCALKDFPVEIVKIPKLYKDFPKLEEYLYSFDALKELIFSKYFQKYHGFNHTMDKDYNLYFLEFLKGKSLKSLILKSKYKINIDCNLFRYWLKEIMQGLRDILYKCTYTLGHQISLKNIFISDRGTKIYFKNLKFSKLRNTIDECHEITEIKLLMNLYQIILDILELENFEEVKNTYPNIEFQIFLSSLLEAEADFRRYREGRVSQRITFDTLSDNPVFKSEILAETDVLKIVEEYQQIYE